VGRHREAEKGLRYGLRDGKSSPFHIIPDREDMDKRSKELAELRGLKKGLDKDTGIIALGTVAGEKTQGMTAKKRGIKDGKLSCEPGVQRRWGQREVDVEKETYLRIESTWEGTKHHGAGRFFLHRPLDKKG